MTVQSDFAILLLHGSVSNMPTMAGPTVKADTVNDMLTEGLVNYIGMGHNHKRWEHKDLQIYNPGSPEYTTFADAPTTLYEFNDGTLEEKNRHNLERGYYLVDVSGEITNTHFQPIQTRDVKNIYIQFNNATASQVSDGLKNAIAKNASASTILRPVLTGNLHPSTSRGDIDINEAMSFRDKFLYLDYPLMRFTTTETDQTIEATDIQQILKQHFKAHLKEPDDATKLATQILSTYSKKTKTSHQEALSIIDGWKPND